MSKLQTADPGSHRDPPAQLADLQMPGELAALDTVLASVEAGQGTVLTPRAATPSQAPHRLRAHRREPPTP